MVLSLDETVKLYKITFRRYTNASRDTVASYTNSCTGPEYLECENDGGKGFIICSEYDIVYYQKFGMGIDTMEYVGPYYGDRYKCKTESNSRIPDPLNVHCSSNELVDTTDIDTEDLIGKHIALEKLKEPIDKVIQ